MSRELDREIAEKVMEWIIGKSEHLAIGHPADEKIARSIPLYSSKIEAAWLVVERMRELNYSLEITGYGDFPLARTTGRWGVRFHVKGTPKGNHDGDSVTEAICRAALKAIS